MSEVTGSGIHKFFLTRTVKENLWDQKLLSDVTGCRRKLRCRIAQVPLYILYVKRCQQAMSNSKLLNVLKGVNETWYDCSSPLGMFPNKD